MDRDFLVAEITRAQQSVEAALGVLSAETQLQMASAQRVMRAQSQIDMATKMIVACSQRLAELD